MTPNWETTQQKMKIIQTEQTIKYKAIERYCLVNFLSPESGSNITRCTAVAITLMDNEIYWPGEHASVFCHS